MSEQQFADVNAYAETYASEQLMDPMADTYDSTAAGEGAGGWVEYFDEDSQSQFWSNSLTGETTWDQPEELAFQ